MTGFMPNVMEMTRKCTAVVNAIVVTRNADLTFTAATVMSGCRLITVATVLIILIARIRVVADSSLLAALVNAKICIANLVAGTITTMIAKLWRDGEREFVC